MCILGRVRLFLSSVWKCVKKNGRSFQYNLMFIVLFEGNKRVGVIFTGLLFSERERDGKVDIRTVFLLLLFVLLLLEDRFLFLSRIMGP